MLVHVFPEMLAFVEHNKCLLLTYLLTSYNEDPIKSGCCFIVNNIWTHNRQRSHNTGYLKLKSKLGSFAFGSHSANIRLNKQNSVNI